ncbi:MAG TPA: HAD family phosphatase [Acidimicrobiales bacterium]|nr:HAD family phosphatase [Acidimicrobiales bacterium]
MGQNRRMAKGPFRLIASDLDGTIIGPTGEASPRTRAALKAARQAGMEVVIATGRPPQFALHLPEHLNAGSTMVCSNGAITYDLESNTFLDRFAMATEVWHQVVTDLRSAVTDVSFGLEWGCDHTSESTFARVLGRHDRVPVPDILQAPAEGAHKLLALHPDIPIEDLAPRVREVIDGRLHITWSTLPFVEATAPGVSKAAALRRYCDRRGISAEEVLAFGDMPNDEEMLAWAGWGVAMGNAHERTKAVADEVTRTCADDGVAIVIERLLG